MSANLGRWTIGGQLSKLAQVRLILMFPEHRGSSRHAVPHASMSRSRFAAFSLRSDWRATPKQTPLLWASSQKESPLLLETNHRLRRVERTGPPMKKLGNFVARSLLAGLLVITPIYLAALLLLTAARQSIESALNLC